MLEPDASIAKRAAEIDSLQRGFTTARDERRIASLFLTTAGAELTALKNAIDAGEDYHTLHELLYHDIDDHGVRAELLAHFAAHAGPAAELKVLSDIDDTFYENWVDKRYPKKTVFPGVRALYRELDIGPAESGRVGDLVFLTARPYDRLGVTDRLTHNLMHEHGLKPSTVLAGDFAHLLTNELIAEEKYKRFLEYQALYPEYEYVFLGDSGQGDALAGRMMLKHPSVRAVFIHDVVETKEAERAQLRDQRIYFHDTYLGATAHAFALGLVSYAGTLRIARSVLEELEAIVFDSEEQRAAMEDYFSRDILPLKALPPPLAR